MKYISLFILTLFVSGCSSSESNPKQADLTDQTKASKEAAPTQPQNQVIVVDFHSTHRCVTCNAIEDGAHYTLETYFAQAVKDKKLKFQLINVDEEENSEVSQKFEATGTALFLDVFVKGHETIIDLTDMAFMKAKNKEDYSAALKEEISKQLSKL